MLSASTSKISSVGRPLLTGGSAKMGWQEMAWAAPRFAREEVNKAGSVLIKPPPDTDLFHAFDVINNWRSSHNYPLNTFQVTLRGKARSIDKSSIIAQRIKRLESITSKLSRQDQMKLSQMQDIGGCRAILPDVSDVKALVEMYKTSKFQHQLVGRKDYLENPKPDGYRSVHLIYKYKGKGKYSIYNDLKVEIQIRSSLQHAWATAVEAVGIFTRQALKSSQGDEEWLRFFALASSAFAEREQCKAVPGTPTNPAERRAELRQLSEQLNVFVLLPTYQNTLKNLERISTKDARYFLLTLRPSEQRIAVSGFASNSSQEANNRYITIEREISNQPGSQAVLVKVDSISALKRAFPNYFADTTKFLSALRDILAEGA